MCKNCVAFIVACLLLVGCGGGNQEELRELGDADNVTNTDPVLEHHHESGPHGGHILELGAYHGEITYADGKVSVYILADDAETAVPLENAEVTLLAGEGESAVSVSLAADPQDGEENGQSSRYSASEGLPDGLNDIEDVHGSVTVKVGEETYTAAIEHDHDHHHE